MNERVASLHQEYHYASLTEVRGGREREATGAEGREGTGKCNGKGREGRDKRREEGKKRRKIRTVGT